MKKLKPLLFSVLLQSTVLALPLILAPFIAQSGTYTNEPERPKWDKDFSKWVSRIKAGHRAERKIFSDFIKQGNYQSALFQYQSAFGKNDFSKSADGKALFSALLIRNNLKIVGLENLFDVAPTKIPAPVKNFIINSFSINDKSLLAISTQTPDAWYTLLPIKDDKKDLAQFAQAVSFAQKDNVPSAAKVLKNILSQKDVRMNKDVIHLTIARLLYQEGYLPEALKHYEKVQEGSDYWFDAQEEKAWTLLRKTEVNQAIVVTQALLNDVFANDVGPESIYLHALVNLKVCDYPEVMKALELFKARFQAKASALKELERSGDSGTSREFVSRMSENFEGRPNWGKILEKMPRFAHSDPQLKQLGLFIGALKKELNESQELFEKSLSAGSAEIGFQGYYLGIKKKFESRIHNLQMTAFSRIKSLATEELAEISDILRKMQLVEAEVLQQAVIAEGHHEGKATPDAQQPKAKKGSVAAGKMSFPYDGEVWFDEMDQYKVSLAKGCLTKE